MTIKLIEGAAGITKAIASISNRGAKLDTDIHACGVSVLAHASAHGDASLCDKLVHAMPKGGRKLALVEWMLAFGQIAKLDPKADKDAIASGRVFKLDRTRTFNKDEAIGTPWTEFKKEAPVLTAFDAQSAVHSVLSRIDSAVKSGKHMQNVDAALREAQAVVAALEGAQTKAAMLAEESPL